MSVTCLFFSPHKLIDSFQPFDPFAFAFTYQQDAYILLSNRLVTSPHFHILQEKSHQFFITSSKLEHDSAQRRTKRKDCLRPALRTYCRFMGRIRLISVSPPLERYLQNMPLLPSSFPRLSVSRYDVSTNTGTTACLHCSCLSCLNVQSCGSKYEHSRSSVQC